ncbi:hypothetical protein SBOR_0382 [Sclerotinia borealis F-4128]|uniref:Uncharacterized protein n=1 Tax=Sclerotinia borealis (strain F-4128) TaxID=1432307 RepID=W9CX63_SCLBF|nr:hypothetical protein SBOR_0382 [Sclerotinia borealis F-4128]
MSRAIAVYKRMCYIPTETREVLNGEEVTFTWACFKSLLFTAGSQLHRSSAPLMSSSFKICQQLQYRIRTSDLRTPGLSSDMSWLFEPSKPIFVGERAVWEAQDLIDQSNTTYYITEVNSANTDDPRNLSYATCTELLQAHMTKSQEILQERIATFSEMDALTIWENQALEDCVIERSYYLTHWLGDNLRGLMNERDYEQGPSQFSDPSLADLGQLFTTNEYRQCKNDYTFQTALGDLQMIILRSSSAVYENMFPPAGHGIQQVEKWRARSNWSGSPYHVYKEPHFIAMETTTSV